MRVIKLCRLVKVAILFVGLNFLIVSSRAVVIAAEENNVYDVLQERIDKSWDEGMQQLYSDNNIAMEGNLLERLIRSIVSLFYRNIKSIKGWSLVIGSVSFMIGIFIVATAKMNKKLRRSALVIFVFTIPMLLIIFIFSISKLISIFI